MPFSLDMPTITEPSWSLNTMSKRVIERDVDESRRTEYTKLENAGEAQKAIWEALSVLNEQGFDIGTLAQAVLAKRGAIKEKVPRQ